METTMICTVRAVIGRAFERQAAAADLTAPCRP